jgi:hypothetical protein
MFFNNWIVDKGVPPFTKEGYEVRDSSGTESYWFQTREWAQLCADHFNRLERIKREDQIINIGFDVGSVSLKTSNLCLGPQPKESDWVCHLFGSNGDGISWIPREGCVPNWFWRKMQYLVFGNKWVRK